MKRREFVANLRTLADEELRDNLTDLREDMGKLRFRAATEDIDNPAVFRQIRRNIARVKTEQRRRAAEKERA
ncbi:MAG: 50S ribosomal protein L29 [Planctomycetes bacterium]|nr:50S ribosomal protein L29 [Planctomycetota bacterium]